LVFVAMIHRHLAKIRNSGFHPRNERYRIIDQPINNGFHYIKKSKAVLGSHEVVDAIDAIKITCRMKFVYI
jgi:hypothetical protein